MLLVLKKCFLLVAGGKAKEACNVDQLCVRLNSGINGGIHAMQLLCDTHLADKEWVFLLIDASNAFNKGNRIAMFLRTICHEWPSDAQFAFKFYWHWPILMLCAKNGTAPFIFSR